jgi:photosystem II stability/assembly factor-like uncharacterized protein
MGCNSIPRYFSIAFAFIGIFMSTEPRAAADPCTIAGPRYRLASDTVEWSMRVEGGQNCTRDFRLNKMLSSSPSGVEIENVKIVSSPQAGQLIIKDTGFAYAAKPDFQGWDSFTVMVSGAINRVPGSSTIRISVSSVGAASKSSLRTSALAPGRLLQGSTTFGTRNAAPVSTDPSGGGWSILKIGGGGFLTGTSISGDNTYVVRTDTYGVYIWNPNATAPKGNAGGTGAWQQLVNSSSMPSTFVTHAQLYNTGVFEIQIAPSNSSVMYMVYPVFLTNTYPSKSGIYKSTDKGASWTQTSFTPLENQRDLAANGPYRMWGPKMAIDPTDPNIVYAGTGASGILKTTNGGTSWSRLTRLPSGIAVNAFGTNQYPGITGIQIDPGNTAIIFAASYGNGVYRSTDGGANWTRLTSGTGPTNGVRQAVLSGNGTYFAIDGSNNLWKYASGAWTEVLLASTAPVQAVAVDPFNSSHVIAAQYSGQLNESFNSGSSWSGWSGGTLRSPTIVANDIPYQAIFGTDAYGLLFDRVTTGKLYINGDRGFWTTVLSGNITTTTVPIWTDQSVGIEQFVADEIIVPPVANGTPLVASWDSAVFLPNESTYPSTFGPIYEANVVAGWSIDYASSDPTFITLLADGVYAGGPQRSRYSTDGGSTWNSFSTLPSGTFNGSGGNWGGNIAASTSSNIIFASANGVQPYYTINGGTTWSPIDLTSAGVVNPYTISSGTYNPSTGLVTLTMSSAASFSTEARFNVNGLSGAGTNLGNLNGNFTAVSASGSTVTYTAATGLGSITITGGNLSGWTNFLGGFFWKTRVITADRVKANTFYLLFQGVGVFRTTDGGATWTLRSRAVSNGPPAQLKSTPGNAGDLWLASGLSGNPGSQPSGGSLLHSTDGGTTWTTIANVVEPYTVGFGASKPGNSYPAVYIVGWVGSIFGIWRSDDQGRTWTQIGPWPNGNLDQVVTICGDPNVYNRVYVGFAGSGYAQFNFLLRRDLDPAANDNDPMWLEKAA